MNGKASKLYLQPAINKFTVSIEISFILRNQKLEPLIAFKKCKSIQVRCGLNLLLVAIFFLFLAFYWVNGHFFSYLLPVINNSESESSSHLVGPLKTAVVVSPP
jgi:hypothetical protein